MIPEVPGIRRLLAQRNASDFHANLIHFTISNEQNKLLLHKASKDFGIALSRLFKNIRDIYTGGFYRETPLQILNITNAYFVRDRCKILHHF